MSEAAAYTRSTPQDRCSLCRSREGPFHFEERPTGFNLELQSWPYCGNRWTQLEAGQKSAADPHVLAAWAKFLGLMERRES